MKISAIFLLAVATIYAVPSYSGDTEWQKKYTREFLNFSVNNRWLVREVSVRKLIGETKTTIQDSISKENDERRAWFLGLYKKGDKIWYFTNPAHMWKSLQGVRGYVLIRKGNQVATYITDTSNIEHFLLID